MREKNDSRSVDVLKLFVILVFISALGFGAGAVYLFRAQAACGDTLENEKRVMNFFKKMAEAPENAPYWGAETQGAGRTTAADLASYLLRKAQTHGVPIDSQNQEKTDHVGKGFTETKVDMKLSDVTLEQVVRYLYRVQEGKNDIFMPALRLTNFDYNQPVPTCKCGTDFVVYEELKEQRSK